MEADGSFDLLLSRKRRNNRAMYLFVCFKWLLIDGYEREGGGGLPHLSMLCSYRYRYGIGTAKIQDQKVGK